MAADGPLGSEGYLVLADWGTVRDRGRHRVGRFGLKDWDSDRADAEYVASMHPLVALAVADWLDRFSEMSYCYGPESSITCAALKVACTTWEQPDA